MSDGIDINKLNLNGLVEYHNTINPKHPVKSFRTLADGRKVIEKIIKSKSPVPIDKYRKDKDMNAQTEVKEEAKPKAEKKTAAPRLPQDMSQDGITLSAARNRKEVLSFHAKNKAGAAAAWDLKAKAWCAKNNKPVEEAPGFEVRQGIAKMVDNKSWPSKSNILSAITGLNEAIAMMG